MAATHPHAIDMFMNGTHSLNLQSTANISQLGALERRHADLVKAPRTTVLAWNRA